MKRTVSMAVLGIAVAGSAAVAGDLAAGRDHGPGRPEQAAQHRDERGGGKRDQRRDQGRDEGRDEGRNPRRIEGRDDRRQEGRDERRDYGRGQDRDDRRWGGAGRDGGRDDGGRDSRGANEWRPPIPESRPRGGDNRGWRDADRRGWRDERGRDWRYSRDWYDRYRADHFRYDRGRYLARQRFSVGIYVVPRGYAPRYWQRGQWLPSSYYIERRHHLADYWRFDLYDPPFAARWVRVGSDALLIDYRSGEVLDVVFELFW